MDLTLKYLGHTCRFWIPDGYRTNHIEKYLVRGRFYETGKNKVLSFLYENRKRYKGDRIAIDVGANIGNHSVFFHDVLGMEVFAFEPNADVIRILNQNASRRSITPYNQLVGRAGETYRMKCLDDHCKTTFRGSEVGSFSSTPLDEILNEELADNDDIALIKIDVEGMEEAVIDGGIEIIKSYRPDLVVEIDHPVNFGSILVKLNKIGYKIFTTNNEPHHFNHTPTYFFYHESKPLK